MLHLGIMFLAGAVIIGLLLHKKTEIRLQEFLQETRMLHHIHLEVIYICNSSGV